MLPRLRFSLVTMFAAVGLIACILAGLQRWVYVPMRTGTMYTAITSRRDWEQFVGSRSAQQQGDFTLHASGATAPEELFKDFSSVPQLWGEIKIPRMAAQPPPLRAQWSGRTRPGQSPLGGWKDWKGSNDAWETDRLDFCGGVLEESAFPPKRYAIDCIIELTIGIRPAEPAASRLRSRLHYSGRALGLMVFSRPIDDELVQLVILDLRP